MPKSQIILDSFNLGGISESPYQGGHNSLAHIVGWDLHTYPGILKSGHPLKKDSGATITDQIKKILYASDGVIYFFGYTSGKVWKKESGSYTLVGTVSPAAGSVGISDAIEYKGYIYYAMQNRLGRWQVGTAFSTRDDDWATFSNGNEYYHPMKIVNDILYIGDGYYVAQVDDTATFTPDALDLPTQHVASALGQYLDDLLVGTRVEYDANQTMIYRWNTWSVSWTKAVSVPINIGGINCFYELDSVIYFQAGTKGKIYQYNGDSAYLIRRLIGTEGTVYSYNNAATIYNGNILLGVISLNDNPLGGGVYEFGGNTVKYPKIWTLPYLCSTGTTNSIYITALANINGKLYVAWKDDTDYGVDVVDYSHYTDDGYIETRIINVDRANLKDFDVEIFYKSIGTNTTLKLYQSVNYGAYTEVALTTDVDRNKLLGSVELVGSGNGATTLQLKVEVDGVRLVELEGIRLLFE